MGKFGRHQLGRGTALGPQLAGEGAARQLCLNLQWPEWCDIECEFDLPERLATLLFLLSRLFFALQLDLQRYDIALVAHWQLQLPGGEEGDVPADLCLRETGQL